MRLDGEYQVVEVLHIGKHTQVLKCNYQDSTVVVKTHIDEFASPSVIRQLKREFLIGTQACKNAKRIIRHIRLVETENNDTEKTIAILVEDIGARSLASAIPTNGFTLKQFLHIAIECIKGVREIHTRNIIHKDIKPANMLITKDNRVIQIDFGCATRLQEENERATVHLQKVYGTLAYLSPEQTGRINRKIDYRTDFYSLGITFYQLLSGKVPFVSKDILELIHAHIAIEPPPLVGVPIVINDIIMKLVKKDASDRYRSCQGILHDLKECQKNLVDDKIDWFEIGQNDYIERFNIAKQLYGREQEIVELIQTFERVASTGVTEVMLVSGFSGVGKSSIIREVQRSAHMYYGYFAAGKYDQMERNSIYSAIIEALQGLIKQILGEGETRLEMWKQRIMNAVGTLGTLIIELIPELQEIIGEQPPVIKIAPSEAKNRLDMVFAKFVNVFVQEEKPLVLFLDDLQWADRESVAMIQMLVQTTKHLLFVGAYRDNEVTPQHPTMKMIETVRQTIRVQDVVLKPLPSDVVYRWVYDILQGCGTNTTTIGTEERYKEDIRELSDLVHLKTGGNPFFTNLFLSTLYSEKLMIREGKVWKWNLDKIRMQSVTSNVISLMTHRIKQFGGETEKALKWASCMGNNFDIRVLAVSMGVTVEHLMQDLYPVLDAGLMSVFDDRTHFAHDRVQEAANLRADEKEQQQIHLSIGKRWLAANETLIKENDSGEKKMALESAKNILEIVDHLNKGLLLLIKDEDREFVSSLDDRPNKIQIQEIAKMNLEAGRKNQEAASYTNALNYFNQGANCLSYLCETEDEYWTEFHDLAFALHMDLATAYFLVSDFTNLDRYTEILMKRSTSKLELGQVYSLCITRANSSSDCQMAMSYGREVFKHYGVIIPPSDPKITVPIYEAEIVKIAKLLDGIRDDDGKIDITRVVGAPLPEDKVMFSSFQSLGIAAFMGDQILYPVIISIATRIMLEKAIDEEFGAVLVLYQLLLVSKGMFDISGELAEVITQMTDHLFTTQLPERTRATHLYNCMGRHWFRPLQESLKSSAEVFLMGMECGEILYMVFTVSVSSPALLYSGLDLNSCMKMITESQVMSHKYHNQPMIDISSCTAGTGNILLGKVPNASVHDSVQNILDIMKTGTPIGVMYAFRSMLQVMLEGDYVPNTHETALQYANRMLADIIEVDERIIYARAFFANSYHALFNGLLLIRIYRALEQDSENDHTTLKQEILDRIVPHMENLILWSKFCPDNYRNKLLLLQAEYSAYITKEKYAALEIYQESIAQAKSQGFTHEQAVALELEGRYLFKLNSKKFAKTSLVHALDKYKKWGALRKMELLETEFPSIKNKDTLSTTGNNTIVTTMEVHEQTISAYATRTMNMNIALLDMESILHASQAISSEIETTKILKIIIDILHKNANANKTAIITENRVVAQNNNTNSGQICDIELSEFKNASIVAIRHVQSTKRTIVTGCAFEDSRYEFLQTDSYIMENKVKSMVCLPVIRKEEVIAVLYVENTLITDCFKPEQVNVLSILTTQVAISLENAKYFNQEMEMTRKLTETEINRAKEKQYHAQQEEFVDRICHEIRNPIQGLLGNCEVLRGVAETLTQIQHLSPVLVENLPILHSCVEAIQSCGSYQKVITDDVLTLSKLEMNKITLALAPMSVNSLVLHIEQMFLGQALKRKIYLKNKLDEEMRNLIIISDYNRISQVLINLVSNAMKFTNEGGVCVTVEIVQTNPLQLLFSVSDTGMGVDDMDRLSIFDRFVQATQRNMAEYSGSGLGLYISKMIVELMGGKIWVEPNVNRGSIFNFTIQCVAATQSEISTFKGTVQQVVAPVDVDMNTPPLRVLVVEDNAINRSVLVRLLGTMNCTCTAAKDGVEGYEMYRQGEYDLVFMDVSMPRMNGYESTKQIRDYETQNGLTHVHIVGLSGNARQEHAETGIQSGMDQYITKPIQKKELLQIVENTNGRLHAKT